MNFILRSGQLSIDMHQWSLFSFAHTSDVDITIFMYRIWQYNSCIGRLRKTNWWYYNTRNFDITISCVNISTLLVLARWFRRLVEKHRTPYEICRVFSADYCVHDILICIIFLPKSARKSPHGINCIAANAFIQWAEVSIFLIFSMITSSHAFFFFWWIETRENRSS